MINKDEAVNLLVSKGIPVEKVARYKEIAYRIKLKNGTALYLYDSGGFYCQGKEADEVREAIEPKLVDQPNNKIFVVYGRDGNARKQLSRLLDSLGLEAVFLDEQPNEGNTIIEQLEKYVPQANYGIALMTPDDVGCSGDNKEEMRPRARQNVILELGMLFMKLGRSRTAIVLKNSEPPIELPSDINGIVYMQFNDNVHEIKHKLIQNLKSKGYKFRGGEQ